MVYTDMKKSIIILLPEPVSRLANLEKRRACGCAVTICY
jgi:hypothetical protein